jgi:hypothetical protein
MYEILINFFKNKAFRYDRLLSIINDREKMKEMFKIIKENNQIPELYLKQLSEMSCH